MSGNWKGFKVEIYIFKVVEDHLDNCVDVVQRYLDTDTLADIFDRYPPEEHVIEIYPA
jgi:hypothetical protein